MIAASKSFRGKSQFKLLVTDLLTIFVLGTIVVPGVSLWQTAGTPQRMVAMATGYFSGLIADAIAQAAPWGNREPATSNPTANDRIEAFLDTIIHFEGGEANIIVGGGRFTDFSDHPRTMVWIPAINDYSSAAGLLQFTNTTWDEFSIKAGVNDFAPESQRKAGIALLEELGAIAALERGDVEEAIRLAGKRWASFPGQLGVGQPQYTEAEIRSKYDELLSSRTSNYSFPVLDGTMPTSKSALFGDRIHPVHGDRRHHNGVDIAMPTGTPLIAFCDGTMQHYRGVDGNGDGFGDSAFFIACDDGLNAWYGHNDSVTIPDGVRVRSGDVVGTLGDKGLSTGPHLHFEIRKDGQAVDPISYLEALR
ncbi:MAG: peptidoglycan DD-metalloendopeptidase family protein [Cyanobacteria bacterium P01_E01_bin.6]